MVKNERKERRISLVVSDLVGDNLDTVCKKYGLSHSEAVRRGLWLMFDAYLESGEQQRQETSYVIGEVVEHILKEKGII